MNDGSEREISRKVLIPCTSTHRRIQKYKSTKCIGNIIDRDRKRKTITHTDRLIQRKIKANRPEPAAAAKAELETRSFLNQQFVDDYMKLIYMVVLQGKKPYVNNINRGKRFEYARIHRDKSLGY